MDDARVNHALNELKSARERLASLEKDQVALADRLADARRAQRRIGFYLETLSDLANRRDLRAYLGDPYQFARDNPVAVTFAPVPSFTAMPEVAELHPFPWLRTPHSGSIRSFSSWRKQLDG